MLERHLLPVLLKLFLFLLVPNSIRSLRILDTVVSCDQNNFVFIIRFQEPFRGIIYSEKGFPNCIYVNASILTKSSYTIKVPLDGCETSYNSDGNLENAIIIQENPSHISESDKKYLLTCVPIATTTFHSLSETVNFGGITVDSQAVTVAAISGSGSADQHLQYEVELHKVNLNGTLQPITGPVYVGDDIAYIIRINSLATDARIGHCWARDAQSTLQLSDDNGCSVQLLGDVWNHFQRQQYGNSIIFRNRIKAWAFPTSNDVNIFCNLHMCHITCHHTSCNDGRQRRNVQMPDNVENNVIQIAKINFHVKNNDKTLKDEKNSNSTNKTGKLRIIELATTTTTTTTTTAKTTATITKVEMFIEALKRKTVKKITSCLGKNVISKLTFIIMISFVFVIFIIYRSFSANKNAKYYRRMI